MPAKLYIHSRACCVCVLCVVVLFSGFSFVVFCEFHHGLTYLKYSINHGMSYINAYYEQLRIMHKLCQYYFNKLLLIINELQMIIKAERELHYTTTHTTHMYMNLFG